METRRRTFVEENIEGTLVFLGRHKGISISPWEASCPFYETTENNVEHLFEVLNEFWDRDIPGLHAYEELMQQGMIFQFGVPPNRIDLISVLEAIEFVEAWKRKKIVALSYRKKKFPAYYVGLDDLIRNKKAVGRDRDKDDLMFLTQLRKRKR